MSWVTQIDGHDLDGITYPMLAKDGAKYSLQRIDAESTGRNQYGAMLIDIVAYKDKWNLTFEPMTKNQLYNLISLVKTPGFTATFPSMVSYGLSATESKTYYAGDISAMVSLLNSTGSAVQLVKNVSFDIIEI